QGPGEARPRPVNRAVGLCRAIRDAKAHSAFSSWRPNAGARRSPTGSLEPYRDTAAGVIISDERVRAAPCARELDCLAREPTDRARHGQPLMAPSFRTWIGGDAERLWSEWRK